MEGICICLLAVFASRAEEARYIPDLGTGVLTTKKQSLQLGETGLECLSHDREHNKVCSLPPGSQLEAATVTVCPTSSLASIMLGNGMID